MPSNMVHFSKSNEDIISFQKFNTYGTNHEDRTKMKQILQRAISRELTPMQKKCIIEYYLNGRKMRDIAAELHLHPSTVTRHIQAAKKRLIHIAEYY